jgi:hypothetical protein
MARIVSTNRRQRSSKSHFKEVGQLLLKDRPDNLIDGYFVRFRRGAGPGLRGL